MAKGAVTIRVDTREFSRALREVIKTDKKGFSYVVNDQAIRLCQAAIGLTKKASAAKIERIKRAAYTGNYQLRGKRGKGGGNKWRTGEGRYSNGAFAIMQHIRKSRKLPAFKWKEPGKVDYLEKLINERKMSLGYIKAGWIPAIIKLATANGHGPRGKRQRGAEVRGKGHGGAKVARPSINPSALVFNSLTDEGKHSATKGRAVAIGQAALDKAVPMRTADMIKKVNERMKRDHAKALSRFIR